MANVVELVDVTLRDGLQSLDRTIPTDTKVRIVEALVSAGFRTLEVASFVHPGLLPQLADAEALMDRLPRRDGVTYRALVPNVRGAERAAASGVSDIVFVLPSVDALSIPNQNRTVEQLLGELSVVAGIARQNDMAICVGLGGAFYVPGHGEVSKEHVCDLARRICNMGVHSMYVASSFGMAHPYEVRDMLRALSTSCCDDCQFGLHLHNRNGLGLANAMMGIEHGAAWLEGAMLGLGGDPWLIKGDADVLGNVPMEDLVHMTSLMGIETGVGLAKSLEASEQIGALLGERSVSYATRGGVRQDLEAF